LENAKCRTEERNREEESKESKILNTLAKNTPRNSNISPLGIQSLEVITKWHSMFMGAVLNVDV